MHVCDGVLSRKVPCAGNVDPRPRSTRRAGSSWALKIVEEVLSKDVDGRVVGMRSCRAMRAIQMSMLAVETMSADLQKIWRAIVVSRLPVLSSTISSQYRISTLASYWWWGSVWHFQAITFCWTGRYQMQPAAARAVTIGLSGRGMLLLISLVGAGFSLLVGERDNITGGGTKTYSAQTSAFLDDCEHPASANLGYQIV
jgi:hypothetical protein